MKRANILKFEKDNRFIMYPVNTLRGGGGIASSPYIIKQNLSDTEVAEELLHVLDNSTVDVLRPVDWELFQKSHLKNMGFKTMKSLHDDSISVSVFTKDNNYYINPTVNKGPKQGFQGATEDRIIISINATIDEMADALKEAFARCK
ncbi:contact-dependent growth inhibition system immunity protein [Aquimarina celericrescens]|uniref:Contact-dependent growth inhibition system immunity protein n=1 Tax=Aquimarina celericrescens TaxID=1964542 RepID=A0ABW5AT91_9FLAO|nr:CdiI family contact-dependent growth inhibition immunity protein [Aquimarina celericrescens]